MNDELEDHWAEAEHRRSTSVVVVYGDYEIEAGVLKPTVAGWDSEKREYFPIATPGVVGEVARLKPGDEKAALAFARRWGLLGYSDMIIKVSGGRVTHTPWGDPLLWIWAHANGIRAALGLHRLLRKDDMAGIEDYLWRCRRSKDASRAHLQVDRLLQQGKITGLQPFIGPLFDVPPPTAHHADPALICGSRHLIGGTRWHVRATDDLRSVAFRMIQSIINPNLAGVYRQLSIPSLGDPRIEIMYGWDSLLSVVYWHLAEMVAGGRVQECQECGMPFLQKHGRQRFCAPAPFYTESKCALKFRQRKHRETKPQGE